MRVSTIPVVCVLLTTGMLTNTSVVAATEPPPVPCRSVSGETSFNAAIAQVNDGECDTINVSVGFVFAAAPDLINISGSDSISTLTITSVGGPLALQGAPAPAAHRGLDITLSADQNLIISNLTFTNFETTGSGGAISVSSGATVTIENSTFTSNSTTGVHAHGGAIFTNNSRDLSINGSTFRTNTSRNGSGGAIAATGTGSVSVSGNSIFDRNTAEGVGGAIYTTQSIASSDSDYVLNVAGNDGGAIDAQGSVTSSRDEFDGNTATLYDGGAVRAASGLTSDTSDFRDNSAGRNGGAVSASPISDVDSTFADNSATGNGGAIHCGADSSSMALELNGTQVVGNTASESGGGVWTNIALTASGLTTFTDNEAVNGGAINVQAPASPPRNITLDDAVFEGNSATGLGGAIHIAGDGPLSITGGRFGGALVAQGNTSVSAGGAIATSSSITASDVVFQENHAGTSDDIGGGGAILASGALDFTRSTFTSNSAVVEVAGFGGGAVYSSSTITARASEFRDNSTSGRQGNGGAILSRGQVEITESIFDGNTASAAAGAIAVGDGSVIGDAVIQGSEFINNSASQQAGALLISRDLRVEDSLFDSNEAGEGGGGARVAGVATIVSSTFRENVAGYVGGAISTPQLTVLSSSFVENYGNFGGGGAYVSESASVTNSTFYGNTSGMPEGAAVQFDGAVESATLSFSTFAVNPSSPGSPVQAPLIFSFDSNLDEEPTIALIGSVLSPGDGDSCGWWTGTTYASDPMPLKSTTRNSIATDHSCSSDEVAVKESASLALPNTLSTDAAPGRQVLLPDSGSVLNSYTPSLGETIDQLGSTRPEYGFTSVGAVQADATTFSGPQDASVEPGTSATFTVNADRGLGSGATYRWQTSSDGVSWSNITGNASARTATLVLPSVTLAQAGLRFRVNVTKMEDGPTAASGAATLTVSTSPGPGPSPTNNPSPSVVVPEAPIKVQPSPQAPGGAALVIDGQVIPVRTESGPRGSGLTLQAGPVEFTVRGQTANGQRVPLAPDGSLILPRTGEVPISGDGLQPNSTVAVTLFSDPVSLGATPVGADGRFKVSPVIPATVPLGVHTLQLSGRTKNGDPFVLSVGVLVETPAAALGADPVVSLRPAALKPGASVAVTARGVQAGCRVTFAVAGERAPAKASAKGTAQAHITLPKRLPEPVVLRATVSGSRCSAVTVSKEIPSRSSARGKAGSR